MVTKNQLCRVRCERLDGQMNGIAHVEGQTVFIPGLLPDEEADIRIVKAEKRYAFGRIDQLLEQSPERRIPPCPCYSKCGGCSGMHMSYAETLRAKQQAVRDVLQRIGGIEFDVPLPIGMDDPYHYRNKTAMPVAMKDGIPRTGYYRPRSHDLTPVDHCLLSMPPADLAAEAVLNWMRRFSVQAYNESDRSGIIRHVIIRTNRQGQSQVTVATARQDIPHAEELCTSLMEVPGVISVCQTVNPKGDNVILGNTYKVLRGSERLEDTLCGLVYQLSPLSFLQVNPSQTERLYETAIRFAGIGNKDEVADVYCGAGTISLLAAKTAKHVTGIEIVPQAIEDARKNAARNGIKNADFICGAAENILPELVQNGLRPDIVLLDPPRKGADQAVLDAIITACPTRIVYVSCDPATLARDLRILTEHGYRLERVQPVDMFCWTGHVESVVKLTRAGL